MNRSWLLRLAPFLIAALCVVTPRVATAAESVTPLRPAGIAPRLDWCALVIVARSDARDELRLPGIGCCSAAALFFAPAQPDTACPPRDLQCARIVSRPLQPPVRAPPPAS